MRMIVGVFALALALVALSNISAFATPSATVLCSNTKAVTSSTSVDMESGQTAAAAGRHWVLLCNAGPNELYYCMGPNGTTTTCTAVSGQGLPVAPNTCLPPMTAFVAPTFPGQVAPGGDIQVIQDAAAPTNSTSYATVCDF